MDKFKHARVLCVLTKRVLRALQFFRLPSYNACNSSTKMWSIYFINCQICRVAFEGFTVTCNFLTGFISEFSNPIWQLDYTFSQKYPSENKFLDANRIYELNEELINQTSNKFWKGYVFSRETNYQPVPYSRFQLFCAMRLVYKEDFNRCIEQYNVPGG